MNVMKYRGFYARVEFDERDNILVGHLAGITDIVGFHGESVAELRAAFKEAVVDYLDVCRKIGKKPERAVSGKILLRVAPEVHAEAIRAAELAGKSLNQWAAETLHHAAHG